MAFNAQSVIKEISRVVLGKEGQVRLALTCLFEGGHLRSEELTINLINSNPYNVLAFFIHLILMTNYDKPLPSLPQEATQTRTIP